jgi:hypothetical protein
MPPITSTAIVTQKERGKLVRSEVRGQRSPPALGELRGNVLYFGRLDATARRAIAHLWGVGIRGLLLRSESFGGREKSEVSGRMSLFAEGFLELQKVGC